MIEEEITMSPPSVFLAVLLAVSTCRVDGKKKSYDDYSFVVATNKDLES